MLYITVGRQFGCGGRKVAAAIGEKLNIPVYDNSVLAEAAKESGLDTSLFKKRDEKRNLFSFSRLFSSSSYNETNYLGDNALFLLQSDAIRNIADKGSCIIVGRCADYILRDREGLLNVFLTAPLPVRVKTVMDRLNVDERTANKIISKKERNRANFYNGYTLGKWGDSATYDLCVDTSRLGIEGTADFIIEYATKTGLLK